MSKWIRRAVALMTVGMLFQLGGCGLGSWLTWDKILPAVAIGVLFD